MTRPYSSSWYRDHRSFAIDRGKTDRTSRFSSDSSPLQAQNRGSSRRGRGPTQCRPDDVGMPTRKKFKRLKDSEDEKDSTPASETPTIIFGVYSSAFPIMEPSSSARIEFTTTDLQGFEKPERIGRYCRRVPSSGIFYCFYMHGKRRRDHVRSFAREGNSKSRLRSIDGTESGSTFKRSGCPSSVRGSVPSKSSTYRLGSPLSTVVRGGPIAFISSDAIRYRYALKRDGVNTD